ncbi:MAG: carotenoid oxygenase family protein [Salinigranum sp.]
MTPGFDVGFRSLDEELDDVSLQVDGTLPRWLSGAYVRNGPARFEVGGGRVAHWFDGLAMLVRFAFDGDRVRYTNRFLRTGTYRDATAGRPIAAMFGQTGDEGILDRLSTLLFSDPPDNANVNVFPFGDRLAAVTETPVIVAVDPETLATVAVQRYDDGPPVHHVTAHLRPEPTGDGYVGYGTEFAPRRRYHVYRITDVEATRESIASFDVDRPAYMHSLALTRRYVVLTEVPFVVNPVQFLRPGQSFVDSYRWRPERGTRFLVFDRASGDVVAAPRTAAFFSFHYANAFERADEVVVDLVAYDDASIVRNLFLGRLDVDVPQASTGRLRRYRLPLDGGPVVERVPTTVGVELPRVSPAVETTPHRYVYGQGDADPARNASPLVKVDVETGRTDSWLEPGVYVGEPAFVPAPDATAEDDGVVLSVAVDAAAETSVLLVLDGGTFEKRARATVPHVIPFGFHGRYVPDG